MCTRTGFSLFIGYATLVVYSIILIVAIGCLADKKLMRDVVQEVAANNPDINMYAATVGLRIIIVLILIACVIMTIASGVLVRGICKKRHIYMLPWLLITFVHIMGSLIYNFVILLTSDNPSIDFVAGMMGVVLQCVIFYPVYTLFREMRKDKFDINKIPPI